MLSFSDVEQMLADVDYKPNVEFEARQQNAFDDQSFNTYPNEIFVRAVMFTLNARQDYPAAREMRGMHVGTIMAGLGGIVHTPTHTIDFRAIKSARGATVPWAVMEQGTEEFFLLWLNRAVIAQLEHHEIDEWFRYKGKLVNDPHRHEVKRKA
jgi:hypothetical protein